MRAVALLKMSDVQQEERKRGWGHGVDLEYLLQDYTAVMTALHKARGKDAVLSLELLTTRHQKVTSLLAAAEQQQDALGRELVQLGKRKQRSGPI